MATKIQKVKATAKCSSFDIEIEATFNPRGLVPDEVDDVKRKLKHKLTQTISDLPFAHIYPFEVKVK